MRETSAMRWAFTIVHPPFPPIALMTSRLPQQWREPRWVQFHAWDAQIVCSDYWESLSDGDVLYPSIRLFNENPASRISWQVCQCLQGRKGRQGRKGGTFNDLLLHAILLHLFDFFADRSNWYNDCISHNQFFQDKKDEKEEKSKKASKEKIEKDEKDDKSKKSKESYSSSDKVSLQICDTIIWSHSIFTNIDFYFGLLFYTLHHSFICTEQEEQGW